MLALGRQGIATVTSVSEVTRRGRTSRRVEFAFEEPDGTQRTGEDSTNTNWTPPADGVIKIVYTPGARGWARFAGHVNWIGLAMFVVAMSLVLFFGLRLWFQARAATKRLYGDDRPRTKKR
jgi:hypothetical protein